MPTNKFTAELWQYPGYAAWYFVTLPKDISDEIKIVTDSGVRRGFGSVKITAQIAASRWETSIFPDKKSESYLLPVKKTVRIAEHIEAGDIIKLEISLQ
ncbi:MAG: DUF1905 domain-containing protein [Candidatus Saccharimonadales bacterium]